MNNAVRKLVARCSRRGSIWSRPCLYSLTPLLHISVPQRGYSSSREGKQRVATIAQANFSSALDSALYRVRVVTADRRGAATEATCWIVLEGSSGSRSDKIELKSPHNKFERGSDYTFEVTAPGDLGELAMVEVLHDGKGLGAAWLIECIIVERQGVSWVFPCGKWMQADDYSNIDHLVHKVLPCKSRIEDAHSNLTNIKVPRLSEPSHNYVNKTNDLGRRGRSFNLIGGWNSIPHPDKAKLGLLGEDACFVLPNDRYPDVAALGVADGVGDWIKKGVDSGVFARMLMASTRLAVTEEFTSDPVKILDRSWSHMKGIPGSSTVCLSLLDKKEGVLRIANLGDSGFILIRNGRSLMRSTPQEHFWGHPYQLSSLNKDQPSDCESYSAQVKKGDIIVLASDGVFDNMFDEEICDIVWRGRFVACHQIASYLAEVAHAKSMSKTEETPFAQVAAEELNMVVNGGKKDDITVVIGKIVYDLEDNATHVSSE